MNSDEAKKLLIEERYEGSANYPTIHYEYECPCKKGKIIYETIPGFDDDYATIECEECKKNFEINYGNGHLWNLKVIKGKMISEKE